MAGAESGETVLRAEILVGLLDASVDLGSLDGHRELGGTGLENLYLRFQHYPPSRFGLSPPERRTGYLLSASGEYGAGERT